MKNVDPISENTEIYKLLQQSFNMAADKIDEGIVVIDMDGIIRFYNQWQLDTDGILNQNDIVGKRIYDNRLITKETSVLYNTIKTGKETLNFEQHYINYNNQYIKLHASAYPIKSKGKLIGALGIYKNLEPHHELARKVVTPNVKTDLIHDSGPDKEELYCFNDLIGNDKQFLKQIDIAKIAAKSDSSTLIYGETGTGKELFAQSIHTANNRHSGPFVAINCSAVPESLFEALLFGTKKSAFTGAVDRKAAPGPAARAGTGRRRAQSSAGCQARRCR